MAKLKNTLAIQQMLAGEHKTQNKISVAVPGRDEPVRQRLIGETWTDVDGIEWEQKDGYVSRTSKVLDEVRKQIAYYIHCYERENKNKECTKNNINSTRQDLHFRIKTGRCLDCQVAFEHQLRIEGKFEEYERRTLYQNAVEWFKEAERDKDDIIAELFTNINYVAGADGGTENWTDMNYEERKRSINEAFYKYKEETLTKLKNDLNIDNEEYENDNIITVD